MVQGSKQEVTKVATLCKKDGKPESLPINFKKTAIFIISKICACSILQKAAEVPIGSLAVSGKTKWEILDNIVRKIFKVGCIWYPENLHSSVVVYDMGQCRGLTM